ncbi:HSP70 nucleotide exchange factor FES1-like protein [Tanacetum coccineum]
MTGHTIDRCFELVDYPPGFKKGNVNHGNVNNVHVDDNESDHSKSTAHTLTSYQYQRLMALLSDTGNASKSYASIAGLPHNVKLANEFGAFEKVVCEFAWELDELEEERKWFMEAMQAQIIDVVKRMKEITLVMQTPGVRWMLDELQEHVEPIDMANDHHTIRGLPPLLKYLSNSHANIRAKAAEVVSTIVQHNPKSQQLFMDANAMEPLLTNFTSDDDVTVRTKTNRSQRPVCVSLALKEGFNLLLFVQEMNERPVREATSLEIYGEDEYIPVTVVNSGMRDSE